MREKKLIENDEYGIFLVGQKIPYYSIILTKEESEKVKGRIPQIYETDGRQLFDIKSKEGEITGEKWLAIIWM